MIQDICNNNFFDSINNIEYINTFCFAIIVFLLLLFLFIQKQSKFIKTNKQIITLIVSFIFLMFICLIIFLSFSKLNYENCYCEVSKLKKIKDNGVFEAKPINDISHNKIIIIGDSRMEYIVWDSERLNIPVNFSFIAKSGSTFTWFSRFALPKLMEKLDSANDEYHYHVIINMGVNDLQVTSNNINETVKAYFKIYKELAAKYHNIDFYLLSVNPVIDSKINDYIPDNKRSNHKIRIFNNEMSKLVKDSKLDNLLTCDSYHNIKFDSPDGLHYSLTTDQDILDYISNKCVVYQ